MSISAPAYGVISSPTDAASDEGSQLMNCQEMEASDALPKQHDLDPSEPPAYNTWRSPVVQSAKTPDDHMTDGLHYVCSGPRF
jgi:hypothetical protein